MNTKVICAFVAIFGIAVGSANVNGSVIDNGIAAGTVGHYELDVTTGGEVSFANITGLGTPSNSVITTQVIFDYHSFVDVGAGGVRLFGSAPVLIGGPTGGTVTSFGTFTGSGGNTIGWNVSSTLPAAGDTMTSTFSFSALTGTLGNIEFSQYLDEDVLGFSNDVFFTQGTAAAGTLELFTLDNVEAIGVSHGGGLNGSQGLSNSTFAGWSADTFNNLQAAIIAGTATYSPTGVNLLPGGQNFNHPVISPIIGANTSSPFDITSALAWNVDPNATTAVIVTSLGGVPQASMLPPVPEPGSFMIWSFIAMIGGVVGVRRKPKRNR